MFGLFKRKKKPQVVDSANPSKTMTKDQYKEAVNLVDMYMVWNDCIQQGQDKHREKDEAKRAYMAHGISVEFLSFPKLKDTREVWWSKNGERFFWGME